MTSVRLAARDLSRHWRELGPKAAIEYVRHILGAQIYLDSDEIVVVKDLTEPEPAASGPIRLEAARLHDLPMIAEFNRRQLNATRTGRFAARLEDGKRALLGFRDDSLIGYIWFYDASQPAKDCYLERFGIRLGEGEVYGDDLFIAPEHRGQGIPAAFVAGVEAELVRLGYRRMYGFVDARNTPARWFWTISGYTMVTRRHTRRVLRWFEFVEGEGWLYSLRERLRSRSALRHAD
jgi:GNAT superfamily N-acetyltransferase